MVYGDRQMSEIAQKCHKWNQEVMKMGRAKKQKKKKLRKCSGELRWHFKAVQQDKISKFY